MDAIRERRRRAAAMREQKQEQTFLDELNTHHQNEIEVVKDKANQDSKIKRTRMQNAKGTSGMFIKP